MTDRGAVGGPRTDQPLLAFDSLQIVDHQKILVFLSDRILSYVIRPRTRYHLCPTVAGELKLPETAHIEIQQTARVQIVLAAQLKRHCQFDQGNAVRFLVLLRTRVIGLHFRIAFVHKNVAQSMVAAGANVQIIFRYVSFFQGYLQVFKANACRQKPPGTDG